MKVKNLKLATLSLVFAVAVLPSAAIMAQSEGGTARQKTVSIENIVDQTTTGRELHRAACGN